MADDYLDNIELSAHLLGQVSGQVRAAMGNLHMAFDHLKPSDFDGASPSVLRNLSILSQSYYRLLRLSKNLSYAALLADSTPFPTEQVELVALVGALVDPVETFAREKDIRFSFTADQPYILTAVHVEYFQMLLYQLLSNALKFTPAGGEIRLELKSGSTITLIVSDTGCGIPAERLDTVFDRYLHPEPPLPPPHGLGLGLALCRCVAQRHGGTVLLNSREGEGTVVTVSLQRVKPERAELSDIRKNYEADRSLFATRDGYNTALTHLADALPYKLYAPRYTE